MDISELIIREAVREASNNFFTNSNSNEALFIQRIYTDGLGRYLKRLESIRFQDRQNVLDAGCGYGQWALALSLINKQVVACDISSTRLAFLEKLISLLNIQNIKLELNGIDLRPYPRNCFDAIFCYSVIYRTEWVRSLKNILNSLSPGGIVYICSNGPGWYLYNYLYQHNAASDFDPRQHAIGSIKKSIGTFSTKDKKEYEAYDWIISSDKIVKQLERKCMILYKGCEGGAHLSESLPREESQSFFIGEFKGVEAVYEIVAKRIR